MITLAVSGVICCPMLLFDKEAAAAFGWGDAAAGLGQKTWFPCLQKWFLWWQKWFQSDDKSERNHFWHLAIGWYWILGVISFHLAIGWVGSLAVGCWGLIGFGPGGPGGCCRTALQEERFVLVSLNVLVFVLVFVFVFVFVFIFAFIFVFVFVLRSEICHLYLPCCCTVWSSKLWLLLLLWRLDSSIGGLRLWWLVYLVVFLLLLISWLFR